MFMIRHSKRASNSPFTPPVPSSHLWGGDILLETPRCIRRPNSIRPTPFIAVPALAANLFRRWSGQQFKWLEVARRGSTVPTGEREGKLYRVCKSCLQTSSPPQLPIPPLTGVERELPSSGRSPSLLSPLVLPPQAQTKKQPRGPKGHRGRSSYVSGVATGLLIGRSWHFTPPNAQRH